MPGRIENWRLGPDGDDLRSAPFFDETAKFPNVNRLFAALYDLIFSKLTNMGHVIPSQNRALKEIFKDKVPGMARDKDHDLQVISPELIAYLKWLIYVAAYEDRSLVEHEQFYQDQVAFYRNPAYYKIWRSLLYQELHAWYQEHPRSSKKRKSCGKASGHVAVVNRTFQHMDDFVDLLDDDGGAGGARAPAAGAALAAGPHARARAWPARPSQGRGSACLI